MNFTAIITVLSMISAGVNMSAGTVSVAGGWIPDSLTEHHMYISDNNNSEYNKSDRNAFDSTFQLVIVQNSEDTPNGKVYNVLSQGEEQKILLDSDVCGDENFYEGDLIVYSCNSSGCVTNMYGIFTENGILSNSENFADFRDNTAFKDTYNILKKDLSELLSDEYDNVDVVFGVIVNKNGKQITMGDIKSDSEGVFVDCCSDDNTIVNLDLYTEIYKYSFNDDKELSGTLLENSIQIPQKVKSAYNNGGRLYLNDENVADDLVFAVARVIDEKDVGEIYLITAE